MSAKRNTSVAVSALALAATTAASISMQHTPRPARRRFLKSAAALLGLVAALTFAGSVTAQNPAPVAVVDDAIPASLTGAKGDPVRGRAIVVSRQSGLCILCHSGPFPEERFQGDLGPDLQGIGGRLSEGQLRLRIVDSGRINAATIMPAYYRTEGLVRVAPAYRDRPILRAGEIEDVVAFLASLRER